VDEEGAEPLQPMRQVAQNLVDGVGNPLHLAYRIYSIAEESGASARDSGWGGKFFQLAEFLEANQDDDRAREAWTTLIRDAATAYLRGGPFPEYEAPRRESPHPRLPIPKGADQA
jgi:hypothetical protein